MTAAVPVEVKLEALPSILMDNPKVPLKSVVAAVGIEPLGVKVLQVGSMPSEAMLTEPVDVCAAADPSRREDAKTEVNFISLLVGEVCEVCEACGGYSNHINIL